MQLLTVKNWSEFQHYKDRMPPWIKLHKALLDDRTFQRLPDASRALAPCLWLLASESKEGKFNGSAEEIAFRVRQPEKWVAAALKPLISAGFFIVVQDASELLADRGQVAVPETETETEERQKGSRSVLNCAFTAFWQAYPKKVAKSDAEKAWIKIAPDAELQACIFAAIASAKASPEWQKDKGQFIPHPATWLNGRRWEDQGTQLAQVASGSLTKPCARESCGKPLLGGYTHMAIGNVCNACHRDYLDGRWDGKPVKPQAPAEHEAAT